MDLQLQNRTYHEVQDSMELLPNYYSWTYGKFSRYISGDVVELGCGSGMGISNYIDKATKVYAVDHNRELLNRVSVRFPTEKVTTIRADLIADWGELTGISADVVVMMDVLEHFQDDKTFLKKATSLLKPDGHLVVKVPAQKSLYSDMDRASGHYRRYEVTDIKRLADDVGLSLQFVKSINSLGGLVYRLKNKENKNLSRTFTPAQLKLINAGIPIISLGDFIPFLPGLSLICMMVKN